MLCFAIVAGQEQNGLQGELNQGHGAALGEGTQGKNKMKEGTAGRGSRSGIETVRTAGKKACGKHELSAWMFSDTYRNLWQVHKLTGKVTCILWLSGL